VLRLTLRDLQFRARRVLVSVIVTSFVFACVLVMSGLSTQFRDEMWRTTRAFEADAWVVRNAEAGPFTGAATFPQDLMDDLNQRGAAETAIFTHAGTPVRIGAELRSVHVIGLLPGSLGTPVLSSGEPVTAPGTVVMAEEAGLRVGAPVRMLGEPFTVVGLTRDQTMNGGVPVLFTHLDDARRLFFQSQPVVTAVLVRGAVPELPEGYRALPPRDVWRDAIRPMRPTMTSLSYAAVLLWMAGTALMGGIAYQSALDRLRDFAITKALGGSTARMVAGLVLQSVMVALAAAASAVGLAALLTPHFPFTIDIPARAYVELAVLASAAGLLASMGAARRAAKTDPALAFSAVG
jgi:putative ABC transport system permease protein